jgi:3-oxoacyl-[acyl-carrier protein] reductase
MKIDLSGRIALVTGATGELGRVMVRSLGQSGAAVAVHYLQNGAMAAQLTDELLAMGVRAKAFQADITDFDSVHAMRDELAASLGHPDIVVTNAVASYKPWLPVLDQPLEDYESQFRTCVMQNVLMAKAFVPAMIERRAGRIIGINTECAMLNHAKHSAYVSGKRGMDGVLRCLAKEIGQYNITVNQIAPGHMISDRERSSDPGIIGKRYENIPLRHRGEDQEIANAVVFLSSELAGFITGAFLPVCGGQVMPAI